MIITKGSDSLKPSKKLGYERNLKLDGHCNQAVPEAINLSTDKYIILVALIDSNDQITHIGRSENCEETMEAFLTDAIEKKLIQDLDKEDVDVYVEEAGREDNGRLLRNKKDKFRRFLKIFGLDRRVFYAVKLLFEKDDEEYLDYAMFGVRFGDDLSFVSKRLQNL